MSRKTTYRSDGGVTNVTCNTRDLAMREPGESLESPLIELELSELEKVLEMGEDELRVLFSTGC